MAGPGGFGSGRNDLLALIGELLGFFQAGLVGGQTDERPCCVSRHDQPIGNVVRHHEVIVADFEIGVSE